MIRAVSLLAIVMFCLTDASAQFFSFGRNKVQYTDFDWRVLTTDHFEIYFDVSMQDLAERGAAFAEESYTILEQKFDHTVGTRIPLIFYSSHLQFEQTNTTEGFIPEGIGGFFEFMKGRVVIPADGSMAQFRHVIRHELVHVFMTSKINRVLSDHRKPGDRTPPLWFTEGLAEAWSTTWDAQAEMVLRDMVINQTVVGIQDMDRIAGTFLMYKEGQAFLEFIETTYGEEKILQILENFWKDGSFDAVFKITLGKGFRELDDEWLYALKKRYFPLLASTDPPSISGRTIVRNGFNSKPVVFETDSSRTIFFIGNRTGYTGIYAHAYDDTTESAIDSVVIQGEQSNEFESFHPFQSRIDVSKQGVLAFVTKSGERDALHLYDIRTGLTKESYGFPSLVSIGSVSWAPTGDRVVFSAIDRAGNDDLFLFTPEDRNLRRLTDDEYDDRDPAWSPAGDLIAFSSDRNPLGPRGVYSLFLLNLRTGAIDYLTDDSCSSGSPAWSKDGKTLAFTSDYGGVNNVWATDMATPEAPGQRTVRQLTHFTTPAFDPTWTRSGDLVFSTFENLRFKITSLPGARDDLRSAGPVRVLDLRVSEKPWVAKRYLGPAESRSLRYRGEYSLDVAQSAISTDPVFGTRGGAAIALSDILGNEQYTFLLYNTAEVQSDFLSSFNIAVSRLSQGQRTNYAYGIYRFTGRRYDLTVSDDYFYERVHGGYFAFSYPLSQFDRIEAGASLSSSTRELETSLTERRALILSNSISFTHDNSLWGPTGPLDGNRFNATFAFTSDVQYSNVNYYTVILDYRYYWRLAERSALATRLWLFYNDGRESRRFVMGGSWDLRGWPRWDIRGQKLWLASEELRFPFIDQIAIRFPFGGIGFWSFRGALFFDAGNAWDDAYTTTLGSIGGGLRLNLGGFLVLRYDIGKRIENNFTRLQTGLFQQFFFGWDF
jgi:hypothetical protein